MVDKNPLYDFGDEGEGEAPTFNERWGSLPVEAPQFNLTPNVALVESTPKPLKQGTDPVTGRPDLKFVPVDDPWANTSKPIKRLLGVGGEERYQLWPERALRSGLSAPLDAMQGKLPTIDPETGDVPRATMEPNAFGRLLGMKGGWQGVSPEGAIGRAQDVASVGGPGGLMNLREEGILGSHGGNLVQPTPKSVAPFYSAVEHAVSNIKQDKMPADQWLGTLTNSKGVKPEELNWTGLKDHLSSKGKEPVTKQEVQYYVNANKVELKEVNKGNIGVVVKPNEEEPHILEVYHPNDPTGEHEGKWGEIIQKEGRIAGDNIYEVNVPELPRKQFKTQAEAEAFINKNSNIGSLTKYSQYQLPGGENYKEMLMTLPEKKSQAVNDFNTFKQQLELKHNTHIDSAYDAEKITGNKSIGDKYQDLLYEAQKDQGDKGINYKSSHWDEPNVLAHVRTNDRNITAPGETTPKKSLHIEEIQSDWHQAGRDKGYKGPLTEVQKAAKEEYDRLDKEYEASPPGKQAALIHDRQVELKKIFDNPEGVLDAPFKKTWHELALKRMIREAAEKGYDRLSWTPGEAQAARYSLEKQVDKIATKKNANGNYDVEIWPKGAGTSFKEEKNAKQLSDFVGKEMADKIIQKHETMGNSGVQWEGEGLKVGGEGMKGFYDKMIPSAVEKIGKEHGVKVKQAKVSDTPQLKIIKDDGQFIVKGNDSGDYGKFNSMKEAQDKLDEINKDSRVQPVHYIDIPESLKNQAIGKGFPLFSSGGHLLNPIPGNPHEQVDNSHHVPYGAGASNTPTGFPVNIDKRIPKYDDKLKLPNGQPADLHKYLTIHEIEEYKAMKAGIPYHKAHHEIATPMEKKAVESDGVSWKEYEHIMDGYLKETEEGGFKNLPPHLYTKPYPHSRSLKMDHGELDK